MNTQYELIEQARKDALPLIDGLVVDPLAIDQAVQTGFTATGANHLNYPAYKTAFLTALNNRKQTLAQRKAPLLGVVSPAPAGQSGSPSTP
jgi:hypothetical protein